MRFKVYVELTLVFMVFLVVTFIVPSRPIDDFMQIVLSTSTFLFAIILGFSIANRHRRLDTIRMNLRENDAILISTYYMCKTYNAKIVARVRDAMDRYLLTQLDYRLVDYEKSTPGIIRS